MVALPGDRLRLHNGILFLNGLPLAEPYATHSQLDFNSFRDDFPDFHTTDPSLDPLWWATMRRIVQPGRADRAAGRGLRARRQPRQLRRQPLLGLRPPPAT